MRFRKQREEPISQFHPFIRFISAELTARNESFFPLIALRLGCQALPDLEVGVYAFSAKRWTFSGLRVEEQIQSRALPLGRSPAMLDTDRSWELVNAARVEGEDWLSVINDVDVNAVAKAFDTCDMQLDKDYRTTRDDRIDENEDRVTFQVQSAEKHRQRLLATQRDLLARYRMEGNSRLIPPTEGRIRAVENKFKIQIEKFRQKAKMTSHSADVVYGVIQVI